MGFIMTYIFCFYILCGMKMCVFLCVDTQVYRYMCMKIHEEAQDWRYVSFSIALCLTHWRGALCENRAPDSLWLAWLAPGNLLSPHISWDYSWLSHSLSFYMHSGTWILVSHSHSECVTHWGIPEALIMTFSDLYIVCFDHLIVFPSPIISFVFLTLSLLLVLILSPFNF